MALLLAGFVPGANCTRWALAFATGAFAVATGVRCAFADAADALAGGDSAFNAEVANELFAGNVSGKYEHIRNAVCLNAAAALVAAQAVKDPHLDVQKELASKFSLAIAAIENGDASRKLQQWIAAMPPIAKPI